MTCPCHNKALAPITVRVQRVGELLGHLPWLRAAKIWEETLGPIAQKKIRFAGLRADGPTFVVSVEISDSLWRQEFTHTKTLLLERFADALRQQHFPQIPTRIECLSSQSIPTRPRNPKPRGK